jgi:DNA-binding transcriptional ArsR family regulator
MASTMTPTKKAMLYTSVAAELRALAHPTRLKILDALRDPDEKLSPTELVDAISPRVPLGNIAHHTRELRTTGLLRPAGKQQVRGAVQSFYRLSPRGRELLERHIDPMVESRATR